MEAMQSQTSCTPRTILLLTAALFSLAASAQASDKKVPADWWNKEWTARKTFTIDTTAEGAPVMEAIGTAPVLVRLHEGNLQFPIAKEDGSDLRFIGPDGKPLSYHIERFDTTLYEAFVWVKVPEIKSAGKTTFTLYYGAGQSPNATRVEDVKGTYDADTVLIYHFSEQNAPATDASGNNITAEKAGLSMDGAIVGRGVRFTGSNPIKVPAHPAVQWADGGSITLSAWINPSALSSDAVVFSRKSGNSGFKVGLASGVPYVEVGGSKAVEGKAIDKGNWTHLAVTAANGKVVLYVNGEAQGTGDASLPALNTPLYIGGEEGSDSGFAGEFDEFTMSRVARSAGFIKFQAINQGKGAAQKLLSFGEEQQTDGPAGEDAHDLGKVIKVIVDNLGQVEWIVIGILGVMAAISWVIMIMKGKMLNAATKGNHLFFHDWAHVANDLTALDHEDDETAASLCGRVDRKRHNLIKHSVVYRLYHVGVEELRKRSMASTGTYLLTDAANAAVRASMDAEMVRQSHRLSNGLVILTICVSGGPFVGLLGTVIGVMIVFAAIAAKGEVNVTAIAPGVAGALLATVAGLAVAIPALFGYNYLIALVKNATSDMGVFIDEFVTRIAEYYSADRVVTSTQKDAA
jgi:biopolymer transport protein ExbB